MNVEAELLQSTGISFESHNVDIDGFSVHYIKAGAGPAVVLIHGLNMGLGQWYKNLAALVDRYTVYVIDLPGAGSSSVVDFLAVDLEKSFVDVVDAFIGSIGLAKVNIIGHSLGGWIALKLALRRAPYIDKIVLVNPLGFSSYVPWKFRLLAFRWGARLLAATAMKPSEKNFNSFFKMVIWDTANIDSLFIRYFYESVIRFSGLHPFYLIHRLIGFFSIKKEFLVSEEAATVKNPMLIVAGEHDPLIPVRELRRCLASVPSVPLVVLPRTGHMPPLENPEQFQILIDDFLLYGRI